MKLVNKFKNVRRRSAESPSLIAERNKRASDAGLPGYAPSPMKEAPLKVEDMVTKLKEDPGGPMFKRLFAERRRRLLSRAGRRPMVELKEDFSHLFTSEGVSCAFLMPCTNIICMYLLCIDRLTCYSNFKMATV